MDGSATFTIVMSRTIISIPVHSTMRAVQRERSCMALPLLTGADAHSLRSLRANRVFMVVSKRNPRNRHPRGPAARKFLKSPSAGARGLDRDEVGLAACCRRPRDG